MVTLTLDERDMAILDQLQRGPHTVPALAQATQCSTTYLRTRLPALADNELVARRDDDEYELTDDGRRALEGTAAGEMDDRLDTPPVVEEHLEAMDLRADRAAAVRSAVAVLTTRGEATTAALVDACYSEHPAGYESGEAWWQECVGEALRALPAITATQSAGESDAGGENDGTVRDDTQTADARGQSRDAGLVWRYDPTAAPGATENS